jgi:8-oxo-dGTP pyrophosphatase MutT (NUDIX family)
MYDRIVAYITWENRLLVFEHTEFPEAGIQVPAGRPEADKTLEEAVMREAQEETGLTDLRMVSRLGSRLFEFTEVAGDIENRHFFHLEYLGDAPEQWLHHEEQPSDGSPSPIEFRFFWVDLRFPLELAWGHCELLYDIKRYETE